MIGAGVFSAWAPAAESAGSGLLLGLAIAALVAFCNATSSAQLAAVHPVSGGTYVYARERLGGFWGHLAGWGFVVGKSASCAAMAHTIGAYAWPSNARLTGVAAIALVAAVNIGGLSRTVAVTRGLLVVSLSAIVIVIVSGAAGPRAGAGAIDPFSGGAQGVLGSAGFLFFAFAGYARIATLGEEVRDPARTIPRAIPLALGAVLGLYAVVGIASLVALPAGDIAVAVAPLRLVVEQGPFDALAPVVRIGATIAALGVLLNLIPGISRTILAMSRNREMPRFLARVEPARSLPVRAELMVSAVAMMLVVALDLRDSIAVSGVAVLTYYAITNASALALPRGSRRWHPSLAVIGLIGCVALAVSLPPGAIAGGAVVLTIGAAVRAISIRVVSP